MAPAVHHNRLHTVIRGDRDDEIARRHKRKPASQPFVSKSVKPRCSGGSNMTDAVYIDAADLSALGVTALLSIQAIRRSRIAERRLQAMNARRDRPRQ